MLWKYLPTNRIFIIFFSFLLNIQSVIINEVDANEIETHESKMTLPINLRLAFMAGHVEVGIELYRLNELKMAAPHLLHPVSETHLAERKGLDRLGFKANVFERVSNSLDNNQPASEIDFLLNEASSNLNELADKVGGDRKKIIRFLLETTIKEYDLSFKNNKIVNIGEYQDAWGFIKVAMYHAKKIPNNRQSKKIQKKLIALHQYWIEGPLPINKPIKPITITNSINSILQVL